MASDTLSRARSPAGSGRALAVWLLGVAVVATTLGMAVAVLRGDGSSFNAFLFLDLGLSHAAAARVERSVLGAVSLAAVLGLVWPRWFLLAPVALYLMLESAAGYHMGGFPFSELQPAAHALRYLAPLALVFLAGPIARRSGRRSADASEGAVRSRSASIAAWMLRLGLAAVFLAHGYEAFRLNPAFIDLVISSGYNLLGVRIEEATASSVLRVIGVMDMVVAGLLLVRPWRAVLAWMAFWGLVTAASRMTSYGWGAYTDVLMRWTHFTAPVVLLLLIEAGRARTAREVAQRFSSNPRHDG